MDTWYTIANINIFQNHNNVTLSFAGKINVLQITPNDTTMAHEPSWLIKRKYII